MDDLPVIKLFITVLNHSGSLGKNFVKFQKKHKKVIHQPKSVRSGKKLCPLS